MRMHEDGRRVKIEGCAFTRGEVQSVEQFCSLTACGQWPFLLWRHFDPLVVYNKRCTGSRTVLLWFFFFFYLHLFFFFFYYFYFFFYFPTFSSSSTSSIPFVCYALLINKSSHTCASRSVVTLQLNGEQYKPNVSSSIIFSPARSRAAHCQTGQPQPRTFYSPNDLVYHLLPTPPPQQEDRERE